MRLHRVAVQAFGPFADRVEVDLDALSEHGLFLLHGPTGAGKTSLLDAVCFALYGVVPGARSSLRHTTLRSDHAAPGVAPAVECELTVGGRRIEVSRSPAWTRPKARGTGTTTEQASVRVRELVDGRWEPLAARLDEAGHLLSGLLGMDARQFTTVVLLPQGDFATFLRAGPDERRVVLERLFGTDRFAAVEAWLAERRTQAVRAVREAQTAREQLLARVDERAAALREEAPDEVESATADGDGTQRLYHLAAGRLGDARAALQQVHLSLERTRACAAEAAEVERTRRELVELAAARQRLDGDAPQVEGLRAALARNAAAAGVRPHRDRWVAAEASLTDASGRLDDALGGLPGPLRSRDPKLLAARADAVRTELGGLATLLAPEAEQVDRLAELARAEQEHTEVQEQVAALAAERLALARERDEAEAQRQVAARAAGRADDARDALERARAVRAAVVRVIALAPAARAADDDVRSADDLALGARTRHLDLVERRLAGMAAELAGGLVDDAPCPVCGAAEHPAPAVATDPVPAAEVAAALTAAERAAADALAARSVRDELVRDLRAAEQAAAGADAAAAAARVTAAQRDVTAAHEAAALLADLDRRVAALASTDAEHARRLIELERRRSWLGDRLAELRTRVRDLEVRLREARRTDPDVAARHARLTDELALLDRAADLARELPGARRSARTARADAETACRAAGLPSLEALDEVLLAPDVSTRAAEAVTRHDREVAGLEQRLREHPETAGSDLATLREALAAASARHAALVGETTDAARQASSLTTRVTVLESTAVALHGLAAEVAAHDAVSSGLAEEAAVVEDLAACALGTSTSNTLRMRLSAYVLAARLEQVAAAASVRLRATSAGRYELRHTDARGKGGGRSGLGLTVVDHWTGQERATATLSGGETFLASLALALGLADVVQAESGGLAIETLFVDEGFGSLDDDTLEMVMACLDELREGGRAVGLVSHLPELRARIPSQLHVVRGERGSTVQTRQLAG